MSQTSKQYIKHAMIRLFFLFNIDKLLTLYKEINNSFELNVDNWNKYVNSEELWNLVSATVRMMTDFTTDAIAYSEPFESIGIEAFTDQHVRFVMLPIQTTRLKACDIGNGREEAIRWATTTFITKLNHMLFKKMYGGKFSIMLRLAENGHDELVTVDDNLNYVVI